MTEIVVAYKDDSGYHYKPMGTKTVTAKVEVELKKNKKMIYSICQSANLHPKPNEKPDKRGYYNKDQISYEAVSIVDDGEFIKKQKGDGKYHDFKRNKVVEV